MAMRGQGVGVSFGRRIIVGAVLTEDGWGGGPWGCGYGDPCTASCFFEVGPYGDAGVVFDLTVEEVEACKQDVIGYAQEFMVLNPDSCVVFFTLPSQPVDACGDTVLSQDFF